MPPEDFPNFDMTFLETIAVLLQKQLAGEVLSPDEQLSLAAWKQQSAYNQALADKLNSPEQLQQLLLQWHTIEQRREHNKQRGMERLAQLTAPARRLPLLRRRSFQVAAAVALLISAGVYVWTTQRPDQSETVASNNTIIAPGREGAILTLADGSQVVLDSVANGVVANQGGAQVMLQNGQLAYGNTGNAATVNTITTPKGRQFKLLLPDGSKVWLNAASAITFPTAFTGNERRISLQGEAYFEIAKNPQQPFMVNIAEAVNVEVLGTSFNIHAYQNENSIKTTLLDGAVKLLAYQQSQVLKPGQQAAVTSSKANITLIPNPDIDKAMAWKNGLFNFDDASLEEVMRELERWYDIEVVYATGIPRSRFGGEINKQNTLQDVLQILEKSDVHFRLEQGRKLVVMP
ncbi:FecR domain-containing protein [Chitinophaga horti]|uniref:FecR domain-containing protein n=1 Tax=Chitinophaga horti TaxID=2920382 RepID=A0ABY6IYE2_9BACT|nr:FecR family protein [Chitinophaga horti]UYQ91166.1 FecR domain-containing protein [Chitinophaga horti]